MLGLSWSVTSFTESNMTLQIIWENPSFISQNTIRDRLVLRVINPLVLIDKIDFEGIKNRTITITSLPQQVIPGDAIDYLVASVTLSGILIVSFVLTHILLHPILMFSLNSLWGMVNSLSLISFFILMNQLIPAHVMIVLEMFYEAATFDLLPL